MDSNVSVPLSSTTGIVDSLLTRFGSTIIRSAATKWDPTTIPNPQPKRKRALFIDLRAANIPGPGVMSES
jgi:hypothetical protein